jgi:hypothetical protein
MRYLELAQRHVEVAIGALDGQGQGTRGEEEGEEDGGELRD